MLYHFEGLLFCTPGERSQIGLVALFDKFRCFFSFRFKKFKRKPMNFCFVLLYFCTMRNFEKRVVVVETIDVDG